MPVGEIIAIGTELLLGEIQDTNTASIARIFRDHGIDLYRTMIVGDNVERIANSVKEAMQRADIILTTGGLGPTVDDPTREAVASVFAVELEFHPALWQQILERYTRFNRKPSENNRRQAYLPKNAIAIENPVGTAPAFYINSADKIVISVPGVPREMDAILQSSVMPLLRKRFKLDMVIQIRVLHCAGVGESQVDEWVSEFEYGSNPTVGLLAHPGRVDIRIAAKAPSYDEANRLIAEVEMKIRQRVGDAIYGIDDDTIQGALARRLYACGWSLSVCESGLNGEIAKSLSTQQITNITFYPTSPETTPSELPQTMRKLHDTHQAQMSIGVLYTPGEVRQSLSLFAITPNGEVESSRSYGGHPSLGIPWAVATAIDFIRRNIPQTTGV
jgi:nicotinamide-nucleotide amidase